MTSGNCGRISFGDAKWREGEYHEWLVMHMESLDFIKFGQ